MHISIIVYFGLVVACTLASAPAFAQVYSWKDPATGQSRFSNIPPAWYSRGETVNGPRVIANVGEKVIDDTSLPYETRLVLSGKSKKYIDKLRTQKPPASSPRKAVNPESAGMRRGDRKSADKTAGRAAPMRKNRSQLHAPTYAAA